MHGDHCCIQVGLQHYPSLKVLFDQKEICPPFKMALIKPPAQAISSSGVVDPAAETLCKGPLNQLKGRVFTTAGVVRHFKTARFFIKCSCFLEHC